MSLARRAIQSQELFDDVRGVGNKWLVTAYVAFILVITQSILPAPASPCDALSEARLLLLEISSSQAWFRDLHMVRHEAQE